MFRPSRTQTRLLRALLLASLLLPGCASRKLSSQFDASWQWDGGTSARAIFERLQGKEGVPRVPAVVGLTGRGLIGRTLPNGELWQFDNEVDVLPIIKGNLVAASGGGKVFGLNLVDGSQVFSIESHDRRLEGIGFDGSYALLLLVDADAARHDQLVLLQIKEETKVLARVTLEGRVGSPEVVAGIGLVPWEGQYLSAFEMQSGKAIGRLLLRDNLHTVAAEAERLFLYGRGVQMLSERVLSHPDAASLKLKLPDYPGQPTWPVDGSHARPAKARPIQILAHPEWHEEKAGFTEGTYGLSYHDLVAGFDALHHNLKWVAHLPAGTIGGDAAHTSLTLCLENGEVIQVGLSDGATSKLSHLDSHLRACTVTAFDEPPFRNQKSLAEQITLAFSEVGPDMFALQQLLLEEMRQDPSPEATAVLLQAAEASSITGALREAVHEALSQRKSGAELLLAALTSRDEHKSRLPTLEVAQALHGMNEKRAATPLARELERTHISSALCLTILQALIDLGSNEQVPQVRAWMERQKNLASDADSLEALELGCQFILKHDPGALDYLSAALQSSLTHPSVRPILEKYDKLAQSEVGSQAAATTNSSPAN